MTTTGLIQHQTTELTRLQVGPGPRSANLVVSTLLEAENITPLILEYQREGRKCDLLFGFPLFSSAVTRLAKIGQAIGLNNLSVMVDHVNQLQYVHELAKQVSARGDSWPREKVNLYVKVDMGGARSGVILGTQTCTDLLEGLKGFRTLEACNFVGLYSHAGHSYSGNDRVEALTYLNKELIALLNMRKAFDTKDFLAARNGSTEPVILTVGATPTTTSIRNVVSSHERTEAETAAIRELDNTFTAIRSADCKIEMHAGVYPVLDVQQLATHALHEEQLNWDSLALTILTEVASLYSERKSPEALIVAGVLALARDPCKAYPGWGILSPWQCPGHFAFRGPPEEHKGWQVAKVSQEHGILRWMGDRKNMEPLWIGQKLRIWPNHACIAGAGFEYYLVVDSRRAGREDEIVDVWVRWNGW